MSKKTSVTALSLALGTAFGVSLAASNIATAAQPGTNPFAMTELSSGYVQLAQQQPAEGRCGEGRCGGQKPADDKKADMEGKCGEGRCGAEMDGKKTDKKSDKKTGQEGKCGEGRCGGAR